MNISHQQAIDVLREWQQKKSIIQGGMADSLQNQAAIFGCVEELDEHQVRIDPRSIAAKAKNVGMMVRLDNSQFSFGSWPEEPTDYSGDRLFRYEAFLIVTFPNGTRCELFVTNL